MVDIASIVYTEGENCRRQTVSAIMVGDVRDAVSTLVSKSSPLISPLLG